MTYQIKKNENVNLPKNFYFIWHYLEWGGAQVLFFGIMKEAKKIGNVTAVMPAGSNKQLLKFLDNLRVDSKFFEASLDGKPTYTILQKLKRHWNKIHCEITLLKYLRNFDLKTGVIHTELAPWQSMWALLWLCRQTTVFVTMHNALPDVPKWRFLLWKLKFYILTRHKNFHVFTANNHTKKSLKPLVSKEFLNTVEVTYANINPEEIEEALQSNIIRDEFLEKYRLPKDKFLVFCVGQFIDRKGRWIFLEAGRELLKVNDDIAFVWISNSKPSTEEFAKAESYGLGENFIFLSSDQIGSEHVDLFKLMRLADVFTLPSYLEGLPISIIEAMALGIPTISTNINAIPEAVKHLETGILIEPGDSEALKNAVQILKDDKKLRDRLAQSGREFALKNFDEKTFVKLAVASYIEAFERK